MQSSLSAVLGVETEPPRYNMRRAASRPPPPSARTRGLAEPQAERTLVQAKPPGSAIQTNEVVVALAQAAAAIAKEVAATQPEPLVAAVDLKHADLQQLVSNDLLLTLMPEAEPENNAGGEHLDVKSGPVGAADASPLDAKPCVGRTSPTDVISAARAGWSVPSPSCAETLTPILAPRDSEQYTHWTPLVAHLLPKTVAPTPPASPLQLVAHSSMKKIRTVAWKHSKPKHVLDEVTLGEGEGAANRHVLVAADPHVELPWSFWQARHSGSAPSGTLTSSPPLSALRLFSSPPPALCPFLLSPYPHLPLPLPLPLSSLALLLSFPPPPPPPLPQPPPVPHLLLPFLRTPSTSPPCPTPSPHLSPGEHR